MKPLLFTYGTLQNEFIQEQVFGGRLTGSLDRLHGYTVAQLELSNGSTVRSYPVAMRTAVSTDTINGIAYQLSKAELVQADAYETNAYRRVLVQLASGRSAWVYIGRD